MNNLSLKIIKLSKLNFMSIDYPKDKLEWIIIDDSKEKDECNYLVITTAPNETIEQQQKVLDCIQLKDFNIIVLNGKNKKQPKLLKKNIILCSKQFLQTKIDKGHDKQKHTKEKTRSIK